MSGSITFSGGDGGTLLFTPSNGPSTFNTGVEFAGAPGVVQTAYFAALGNSGAMETVEVNEKGAPDTITLDDVLIEIAPGVQGAMYVVNAGSSGDTVNGSSYGDTINGEGGDDTINGNGGDDVINGGNNRDTINGNTGDDIIDGGRGGDTLRGGQNNDTVNGGDGRDFIFGDLGRDTINGDAGNDVLTGGGAGDTFVFDGKISDENGERDRIVDMRANDMIDLRGLSDLSTIKVLKVGGNVRLLLDNDGGEVNTINVGTNQAAQDLLLQDAGYGTSNADFVKVSSGVNVEIGDNVFLVA